MNAQTRNVPTYVFATLVLGLIAIFVIPLPPVLMDALLAFDVLASAIVLLISVTVGDALEFAAFAPTLVIATLFRLALDFSATRLILTRGDMPGGVGDLIPAFGEFVVRGNVMVGIVLIGIIITIQFIVIAAGSGRVAEVAARFTLDAMPGKQMAIDAELHSGAIDAEAARKKRATVQKEADFYAAMDGAGKFVKGDAIATLIVVLLNLIGGMAIGLSKGMSPGDAVNTFAILSIGNALATTLPAFLMAIAMAMMVTRVAADGSLGFDVSTQILARPDVLRFAAVFAFGMACVPVFPRAAFIVLGIGTLAAAQFATGRERKRAELVRSETDLAQRRAARRPENALATIGVDVLAIEMGSGVAQIFLRRGAVDQLLDRIGEVRREIAKETGIVMPGVQVRDNAKLDADRYAIRVRDELAGSGTIPDDRVLAVGNADVLVRLEGEDTTDPVYGLPAKWVATAHTDSAMAAGAMVFDPIAIVGSHVAEITRTRAAAIFGRQEMQTLIEHLKTRVPALVKEIGTDALPLATLHKTLVSLLKERVWPRDPVFAIETIVDASATTRDPRELAETARKALVPPLLRQRGIRTMPVIMFDPEFEYRLSAQWLGQSGGGAPDPRVVVHVRERIEAYVRSVPPGRAAIVCTAPFRRTLADLVERFALTVQVFAFGELPPEVDVRPVAIVEDPALSGSEQLPIGA